MINFGEIFILPNKPLPIINHITVTVHVRQRGSAMAHNNTSATLNTSHTVFEGWLVKWSLTSTEILEMGYKPLLLSIDSKGSFRYIHATIEHKNFDKPVRYHWYMPTMHLQHRIQTQDFLTTSQIHYACRHQMRTTVLEGTTLGLHKCVMNIINTWWYIIFVCKPTR